MADSERVAVELDGVSKAFAATDAVADLSISVTEGEFFTLVGPSGCGKTTTLRLIGGFDAPTSGTVQLDGDDVSGRPPEDRDVGIVFQNYALFPHMTVRENVAYGLKFTDPPDGATVDERVEELLSLVDLAEMGDREPDQLSGGQQQRIALARALAPGPSVLLLDEPMSALDAELRERLRVQLREIQQELDITTIYVTHDQEEALAISDRVAVMRAGRIEQTGEPREIYERPATEFVASFVGDNNVFRGEVREIAQMDTAGEETTPGRLLTVAVADREFTVAMDGEQQPRPGASGIRVGEDLVFCVRPEDLVVDHEHNSIPGTVRSAEFLGATTRVHLDWQGREILARTATELDGEVALGFEPAAAHVVRDPTA